MRRALAAALLGISLWMGSLAWSGFVLLRTVLDPDRSREVAETLYDDETVRAQLAEGIAATVDAGLPPGVPVPRSQLEAAAADALDSPAVEAVFVDALARTHAAFLGEGEPPTSVDPAALGVAARQAVVDRNPELDAVLPASPELAVPLPTDHVPDLGPVRDAVAAAVPLLALSSATGALVALLVTSNRPAVLRRAGAWAIGLSATVLVLAYGVPFVAEAVLPGQAAVIAALVRTMAEAIRAPAVALSAAGISCVALASVWRRAPTPAPAPAARDLRSRRRPSSTAFAPPRRDLPRPVTSAPMPDRPPAPAAPPSPIRSAPSSAATLVQPPPRPSARDATAVDAGGDRRARWVDGAGWVLDPSEPIPSRARWVPGVGYVLDER